MKIKWSRSWLSSAQPRKQRKYRYNAPLHVKTSFLSAHLSKDLRDKYSRRAVPLRKKDKVKVLRGQFKGVIGEVERIDRKNNRVFVKGAEVKKKDGTKLSSGINPSNIIILSLNLDDKKRVASIEKTKSKERLGEVSSKTKKVVKKETKELGEKK